MKLTCFKAYDIRGQLGTELNEDIVYRIGRAFAEYLKPKTVVVGGDVRETSESLKQAVARGLQDAGTDVIDIGMCGTEEIYFATSHLKTDGGIVVTASHNPIDYNGMKMVREGSRPISGDTGLNDVQAMAEANDFPPVDEAKRGQYRKESIEDAYVEHLLSYVDKDKLKPLKLVVNAGNGAAGHVIDALEPHLPMFEFIKVHHEPDATFPNGIPNPLLRENRASTSEAVIKHGADMGIAWDGDFDRCFLFDEKGEFTEGYYIVGLLAEAFLLKVPGSKIIHDPRLTWNTIDICEKHGGKAIQSKTGHFVHQRADAQRRRHLRRRNERPPLFPGFCLLRQRHGALAAGGRVDRAQGQKPLPVAGRLYLPLSLAGGNQQHRGRCRRGHRPGLQSLQRPGQEG